MADIAKGEVELTADGQTYTLALDVNALVLLEDRFDAPFSELIPQFTNGRVKGIRTLVWAALQSNHPGMTEEDAGRLITACGGLAGFAKTLARLTGETQPDARDVTELGGDAPRPPKAQAVKRANGTGGRSISTPAALA